MSRSAEQTNNAGKIHPPQNTAHFSFLSFPKGIAEWRDFPTGMPSFPM